MPIVTKLELIRENKKQHKMDYDKTIEQVESVLFQIGQEAKIHKIDKDNAILEIDYQKYSSQIMAIVIDALKS